MKCYKYRMFDLNDFLYRATYEKKLYYMTWNALHFRLKIKRCEKCGDVMWYMTRYVAKHNHRFCMSCLHKLNNRNKKINLTDKEMKIFADNYYTPLSAYFEGHGNYEESFYNNTLKLAEVLKSNGLLKEINLRHAKNICFNYLKKAIKGEKRKEINFSDLSDSKKVKFGLEELIYE